ncbi:uncharacterized protein B0I36DRAFT_253471 [Microdochium trichocladiopsis]|uniref:PH domain-containing protein n=1 Tax=Microdochium trichocladiopsis TaxID=1682393 RepID=A0A9P8XXD7_9PEZI|nr:uncharacterized protein B0I36DRAFT_253471 [Microdochium trichocladiopsis]KAH7018208.1 hypothetical protein B0I36DRAFT_253471 [Microdochium trichocladiopsis]
MEEAGKLGTALVQQRKQLEERLQDLDSIPAEEDITPDLREKLTEIEKEYNEVARESARAFLPKQRVPSNEAAAAGGSPFVPEVRSGRRSVSPSKFEAQATGSPTKLSVPNRKIRNQPANRIHDIEFATEISTSLIAQVRNLQALLAEKEEELREVKVEKSKLEYEAEGFQQRVKSLDESEHRYKDENWNLETQIQQLTAAQREAADKEKKLLQNLNLLQAEKNAAQRELDETKLNHAKLVEEHAAAVKQHDIELGTAKRTLVMADSDKATLRKKIDDLTGQNTELAKAFSSQRGRGIEREPLPGMSDEDFETANDNITPEHSPPASPVKGTTPRHSMLETETLKTSLGHAQRTIQSLRTNYHREKTEKMELRRMLQDARDELEKSRQEPLGLAKRARKTESREFKKPPRLLGGVRSVRSEIFAGEDPNWEDQIGEPHSPSLSMSSVRTPRLPPPMEHDSDQFETANDASDAAFETANERGTDTDFHTGAEEFTSDDAQTETESPSKRATKAKTRPVSGLTRSDSLLSSASTEDDEYPFESDTRSLNAFPPLQARFPLRVSRGANRRSRYPSEEPNLQSSPASLVASSTAGTPHQTPIQSLAAELGDFDGSDNESTLSATPSRRSLRARTASPPPALPPLPRLPMVDSGTMTDSLVSSSWDERPISMATVASGLSTASYSDAGTQDLHDNLDKFPTPPTSAPSAGLGISNVHSVSVESLPEPDTHAVELAALKNEHADRELSSTKAEGEATLAKEVALLKETHAREVESLKAQHAAAQTQELENFKSALAKQVESSKAEGNAAHSEQLEALNAANTQIIEAHKRESEQAQAQALDQLRTTHERLVEELKQTHASQLTQETEKLAAAHAQELQAASRESTQAKAAVADDLKREHSANLAQEVERLTSEHAQALAGQQAAAEQLRSKAMEDLAASHKQALEDLRNTSDQSKTKEIEELKASHALLLEQLKAEHEGSRTKLSEELKTAHEQALGQSRREAEESKTAELSALALAHAKALEDLRNENGSSHAEQLDAGSTGTVRIRRSQDSLASSSQWQRIVDPSTTQPQEATVARRPGSAASARASIQDLPPLPANHREVIEAARTQSSSGGKGTMGPPLMPASAYRSTSSSRPRTPGNQRPMSSQSTSSTMLRAGRASADVQSPQRLPPRSRQSSVSSFASEIDTRFNIRGDMGMHAAGFGPNTDPRMIQAITQTMIGEYLWKYTRKAGRGEMSGNRHRRYFWVHPYTRTLYWGDRDPSTAGRSELKAKSVSIEAVRVVTDDNPMPPGLHRKSLIVISPGRTVKFTCTTGQRHETWFNALSYLLLRTGNENQADVEDIAGQITQEDIDEFNPSANKRPANGTRPRPPASLSSYNSRTTRGTDSPQMEMSMAIPTLTPTHERGPARPGTLSRLSGYWKSSTGSIGTFSSRRGRGHVIPDNAIYEASEVHDSAEDLRQIIEQQDRESDKLENVRACCDGKHDVGSLSHTPARRGRLSSLHAHPSTYGTASGAASNSATPVGTVRS